MIIATLASGILYYSVSQSVDVADKPPGAVYYAQIADTESGNIRRYHQNPVVVTPLAEQKFRGVVRQAYDYSCGSAALTTLLNGYLGASLTERQTMNGLMRFGERERILQRRKFSLLDMKRFVTALGIKSGGYKATLEELKDIGRPAIVLIHYAGFEHFVVYKGHRDGRIFVADPALGNISFMENRFLDAWDETLFMITPEDEDLPKNMLTISDEDMRVVEDSTINLHAFSRVSIPLIQEERTADKMNTLLKVIDADPESETYQQPIDVSMRMYYRRK